MRNIKIFMMKYCISKNKLIEYMLLLFTNLEHTVLDVILKKQRKHRHIKIYSMQKVKHLYIISKNHLSRI